MRQQAAAPNAGLSCGNLPRSMLRAVLGYGGMNVVDQDKQGVGPAHLFGPLRARRGPAQTWHR